MITRGTAIGALGALALLLGGCATDPAALRTPDRFTCFSLQQPLVAVEQHGEPEAQWKLHMAPGLYFSEKVNNEGIWFRAPPGGVYQGRTDQLDAPAGPATHLVSDGGVFVPHDRTQPPRVYVYTRRAPGDAAAAGHSPELNCGGAIVLNDASARRVALQMVDWAAPTPKLAGRPEGPPLGVVVLGVKTFAIRAEEGGKREPALPVRDPLFQQTLRLLSDGAVRIGRLDTLISYPDD